MATRNDPVALSSPGARPETRSVGEVGFVLEEWAGFVRFMRAIDWLAAGILVVVAFLLALTTARNSDLWLHLATGRALLNGTYHFGHDPFSFDARAWVNHNWLLDTLAYLVYRELGASALVWLKAILAALLTVVLLQLGRVGRVGWHQVLGAALALLAISPRLTLQPAVVSYVMFALLWLFLELPLRRSALDPSALRFRQFWPVLVIMALWANLDSWFLLGLVLIAATFLGELVRGRARGGKLQWAPLGLVLLAAIGVCLLNPHHFRVFLLPGEIRSLWEAPAYPFEMLNLSPLENRFFGTTLAHSVGGAAWLVLLGVSLAALVLNWRHAGSARAISVWGLMLGVALLQARAIPFFAIVAGPLFARGWQEFAERRWGQDFRSDTALRASFSVRVMSLLVFFALPVLAWAGWLQPEPYTPRGCSVEVDGPLKHAAEQWHAWRRNGQIRPDEYSWNSSPDVAHYWAWFGAGEPSFLDSRYTVPDEKARADYERLHAALAGGLSDDAFFKILRERGIRFVVVHGDEPAALTLHQYAQSFPDYWSAVFQDGSTTIFYWHGGKLVDGSEAPIRSPQMPVWQPAKRAFQTQPEQPRAETPSPQPPRLPDWKSPFIDSPVLSNPYRDEAELMLRCFESERHRRGQQYQTVWTAGLAAALAAPTGVGTGSAAMVTDTPLRLALVTLQSAAMSAEVRPSPVTGLALQIGDAQVSMMDEASPSWVFLAIRSARRALQAFPEDARAWQVLGEAYQVLQQHTAERAEFAQWFDFRQLCNAQIISALTQAIKLNPNLDSATLQLANHYRRLDQPELALPLFRQLLNRLRARGSAAGETPDQFAKRLQAMSDNVKSLEKAVSRERDIYEANAANQKIEDRAGMAYQRGLAQTALDTLQGADAASFGRTGLRLEMELLLLTGAAFEVREDLTDEYINVLTELDFRWAKARANAAIGDYARADEALQRMSEITLGGKSDLTASPVRQQCCLLIGAALLQDLEQNQSPFSVPWVAINRARAFTSVQQQVNFLGQYAEIQVTRGLLALEAGNSSLARECFQRCLAIWGSDEAVRTGAGIDFQGRRLAQHYLELMETASR